MARDLEGELARARWHRDYYDRVVKRLEDEIAGVNRKEASQPSPSEAAGAAVPGSRRTYPGDDRSAHAWLRCSEW